MTAATTCSLKIPKGTPYSLRLTALSHGWINLDPFAWDDEAETVSTRILLPSRKTATVAVRQRDSRRLAVTARSSGALTEGDKSFIAVSARRILALDQDMSEAYGLALELDKSVARLLERGGGRLLKAPSLWEDAVKTLFTTNASWGFSQSMTRNLIEEFGTDGAFPPPSADVAAYAKEHGLDATVSLDLGGGVKMEFVLIPAGKFMMGSPETGKDRRANETQHEVTISKPFYMGRYEVTQEQYEAITGMNPSHFKGAKNPVETVSWEDAQEFCKKLSAKTGKTVQLPTEAQWEYACRAGTKTRFYSGDADGDLDGVGWYDSNSGNTTHPVGEKKPNSWGLYDMHGNVWEWCQDWYGEYAAGAATDPQGAASGPFRVLRGGCWRGNPESCRSAYRYNSPPGYRVNLDGGFRVVLAGPP